VIVLSLLMVAAAEAYSYRLGYHAIGPSEAYSVLAAEQPSITGVAYNAMHFDPGKPVLYHLLLHWFCAWFGTSEAAVRTLSVTFGVASVVLVFALGEDLVGTQVGLAAAAMWTFSPLAVLFARWARMYSMFVALCLAHLLALAKLHRRPTRIGTLVAGVLGAAMLYTHLAAVLILLVDMVVVMREWRHTQRSVTWPVPLVALLLFSPFIPAAAAQSNALLFGHWVDWIGVPHSSTGIRVLVSVLTIVVFTLLGMSASLLREPDELAIRCSLYFVIPLLMLAAGSVVIRPMFTVRYVAPSFAVVAVLAAAALDRTSSRIRADATIAITGLLIILLPLTYMAEEQPWREIATEVAARSEANETIFFEAGFFSAERLIDQEESAGFPQGFFRVPFQYYFKGPNPNGAIPGDDPSQARRLIQRAVLKAGGAWLVSGKKRADALAELPSGASFQLDFVRNHSRIWVLHVRRVHDGTSARQMMRAKRGYQAGVDSRRVPRLALSRKLISRYRLFMDNDTVLVSTMNDVPGYKVVAVYGEVFGLICRARNAFSNIGAGLRTILGGEVGGYTQLLSDSRQQALERLRQAAMEKGANAVLAMRFDCNEIGNIMSEIAAYGTAVRVERV
jgi:uncharacterized protein YbjQ (UPF0145 family)